MHLACRMGKNHCELQTVTCRAGKHHKELGKLLCLKPTHVPSEQPKESQVPGWHLHEVVILVHMFLQPCIRAEGLGAVRTGHRGVCSVDMVVQLVGIGEHLVTELAEQAWVTLEAMGHERRVVEEELIASSAIERWRQWERGGGGDAVGKRAPSFERLRHAEYRYLHTTWSLDTWAFRAAVPRRTLPQPCTGHSLGGWKVAMCSSKARGFRQLSPHTPHVGCMDDMWAVRAGAESHSTQHTCKKEPGERGLGRVGGGGGK